MRSTAAVAVMVAMLVVVAGCDAIAGIFPGPASTPQPCGQVFNAVRCLAMTDAAASQLKTRRDDVVSLEILPEPTPEVRDGVTILQTRGGAAPIDLRVTLADGTTRQVSMCGGIPSGPACMDDPQLTAGSMTGPNGGYRDVPCAGEPPDGCPTPFPSFEPKTVAAAKPLTIAELAIPIDHEGPYEVSLGEGSLPNGVLTEASFTFAVPWPDDVSLTDGQAFIQVRSLEPGGKPFENYYTHGWHPGIERVEAVLVFNVLWAAPGAKLGIRDVVVR
jgi:hypothetical protein